MEDRSPSRGGPGPPAVVPVRPAAGRTAGLDGLRAVAAVTVMLLHFGVLHFVTADGVELFFVLSGYLITTVVMAEVDATGGFRGGTYAQRRAARLLPLLVVVSVAVIPAAVVAGDGLGLALRWAFGAVGLLGGFGAVALGPLGSVWSITHEAVFYATWPVVLISIRRHWPPRRVTRMVTVVAAIGLVARSGLVLLGERAHRLDEFPPLADTGFLAGAALACWVVDGWRIPARVATVARIVGVGIVVGASLMTQPHLENAVGFALADLASVAAIAGVVAVGQQPRTLLAHPVAVALGTVSYGIYLIHLPMRYFLGGWTAHHLGSVGGPAALVAMTVGLSAITWRLVERPAMRWAHRVGPAGATARGSGGR